MKNKEKRNEYIKLYRLKNKNILRQKERQWEIKNKDKIKARKHQYYLDNRERVLERNKKYNKDNRNKLRLYDRKYRKTQKGRTIQKNRSHIKRTNKKFTDITATWLNKLFNKTKTCPICKCKMDDNPKIFPNGKQLDHIIPIGIGGSHIQSNVRFICFKCNCQRPKDGSDNLQLILPL